MAVKFVTRQEDLIIPKGGVVIVDRKPGDLVVGANNRVPKTILRPDGQHDDFLPVVEIQRLKDGTGEDTYWCATCSRNNCLETVHKEKFGHEINIDDQFVAVGSGTRKYVGNSLIAVAEWGRRNGFILEKNRLNNTYNIDEVYIAPTTEELDEGKRMLNIYEMFFEWVDRPGTSQSATPEEMMKVLQYGPIQACVDGSAYSFNQQGFIGEFKNYTHAIMVFGYEKGKYWKIFDSETRQALKFAWDYPLGFPMLHSIEKKTMKMYKKNGQAAIGFVNESKDGLILWTDGVDSLGRPVTGGSIFKTMGFMYSLAEPCVEWPLPIVGYAKVGPQV